MVTTGTELGLSKPHCSADPEYLVVAERHALQLCVGNRVMRAWNCLTVLRRRLQQKGHREAALHRNFITLGK